LNDRREGYQHIYASFNRPIDAMWANLHNAEYQHEPMANWNEAVPWTWIITKDLLPEEILKRYELTWGWSPINYKEL
jgi:hypothetical protein